jgi:GTP-binding protein HflX
LLTDTVGFIHKLPHHLIEAFHSTLEEVAYADVILHVVDGSNPSFEKHMRVVYETLEKLDALKVPIITLFNKMDKTIWNTEQLQDERADKAFYISAKTGKGIDDVITYLEEKLRDGMQHIKVKIPYDQAQLVQNIRTYGQLIEERFDADGIYIEAYLEEALVNKYEL